MANTYEPIATSTLGSAAATITFSSIPSTYTDLRLVFTTLTATGDYVELRFNGDSATNYNTILLGGDGSSAYSNKYTGMTAARVGVSMGSATIPTYVIADISLYSSSIYKVILSKSGNASSDIRHYSTEWHSTSAINSLTIRGDGGGNLAAGSTATIFGIKAA